MGKKLASLLSLMLLINAGMSADTAPNFKLRDLSNKRVELKELLKKGPVILDFWATWCKPCIKAFPKLNALHEKYQDQGLTVVGINEDGSRNQSKVKPFVRSMKIKFSILIDDNNDVMRRMQAQTLPTTLLIAPDGKIVARHTGYSADAMKRLEAEVVNLLENHAEEK